MSPCRAALLAALLALSAVPSPARARDFAALASGAERLESLEPFLARYVGRCKDTPEKRTCEANVAAARRAVTGKTFTVRVTDAASLVRPRMEGAGFLLLFTPFVDGGGLALTHGAPARQDAEGHPLVGLIPIRGKLPPGTLDLEFQGPFRTGAIEVEIVFRPEKTWKLPRKGERGSLEGVAARFLGIRVLDARTGNEIASRVL
ncbi:MAG TPA: DUF6066 family protein [Anaeromyxobacter sp.]